MADRRVGKTRRALQVALIDMMLEKEYDSITVQNIIDKANVGRSTFYAHFVDKQDLYRSGFTDLIADIMPAANGRLGFSLPFLEHCHDHRHIYRALSARRQGGAMMRDSLGRGLQNLVRHSLGSDGGIRDEARIAFVVGAYIGVVTWWLDTESTLTPAEVDAMFQSLAMIPDGTAGPEIRCT
jgi:AcrR family transcriptional regulator